MTSITNLGQKASWNIITNAIRVHKIIETQKKEKKNIGGLINEFQLTKYDFSWFPILIGGKKDIRTQKKEPLEWVWVVFSKPKDLRCNQFTLATSGSYARKVLEDENITIFREALLGTAINLEETKKIELTFNIGSTNLRALEHFNGVYLINIITRLLTEQNKDNSFFEKILKQDKIKRATWNDEQVQEMRSKWKKKRSYFWSNWNSPYAIETKAWRDFWEKIKAGLITLTKESLPNNEKVINFLNLHTPTLQSFIDLNEWSKIREIEKIKEDIETRFVSDSSNKDAKRFIMQSLDNWELEAKPVPDLTIAQINNALKRLTINGKSISDIIIEDSKWPLELKWDLRDDLDQNNFYFQKIDKQVIKGVKQKKDISLQFGTYLGKIDGWLLLPFLTPNTGRWALLGVGSGEVELEKKTTTNKKYFYLSFSSKEDYEQRKLISSEIETELESGELAWIKQIAKEFGWKKFPSETYFPRQESPEHSGCCLIFYLVHILNLKFDPTKVTSFKVNSEHFKLLHQAIDDEFGEIKWEEIIEGEESSDEKNTISDWAKGQGINDEELNILKLNLSQRELEQTHTLKKVWSLLARVKEKKQVQELRTEIGKQIKTINEYLDFFIANVQTLLINFNQIIFNNYQRDLNWVIFFDEGYFDLTKKGHAIGLKQTVKDFVKEDISSLDYLQERSEKIEKLVADLLADESIGEKNITECTKIIEFKRLQMYRKPTWLPFDPESVKNKLNDKYQFTEIELIDDTFIKDVVVREVMEMILEEKGLEI